MIVVSLRSGPLSGPHCCETAITVAETSSSAAAPVPSSPVQLWPTSGCGTWTCRLVFATLPVRAAAMRSEAADVDS